MKSMSTMSTNKTRSMPWRVIFTLIMAIVCPSWAAANPTVVQSVVDASSTPWVTDGVADVTVSSLTVGSTACIGGGLEANRTFSGASDNGSNTYSIPTNGSINSAASSVAMACAKITNPATVVSLTASSASGGIGKVFVVEFAGTGASAPTVATNLTDTTGTTHTIPTLTITGATPTLLGFGFTHGSEVWTIDATYTQIHNANNLVVGYKAVSTNDDMANTTATNAETKGILVEIVESASVVDSGDLATLGAGR